MNKQLQDLVKQQKITNLLLGYIVDDIFSNYAIDEYKDFKKDELKQRVANILNE